MLYTKGSMVKYKNHNLSLKKICNSGQCFRMEECEDGSFTLVARDKFLRLFQEGDMVSFDCSKEDYETFFKDYFDLDTDYDYFVNKVDAKDEYLSSCVECGMGIRILKQDLWEMIVSFLISQRNTIKRIRKCISNICEKYGEKKQAPDGSVYYAFPTPESMADLDEKALMECNLGYRSAYVVRAAKAVANGEVDLEKIASMDYEGAREELMKMYGIGAKVADCICLFALHKLESFPVDTHISQAVEKHYGGRFPFEKYEGFEGVMQQYIFYYEIFGEKTDEVD